MPRHTDLSAWISPYHVYKFRRLDRGWAIWDRRRARHLGYPGDIWLYPTHAAAIAALDAHLREQAATETGA